MRIIGRSAGALFLACVLVAMLLLSGYLVGYWAQLGESWIDALTRDRLIALPVHVVVGLSLVAGVFSLMAGRLAAYATGERVRPVVLIVVALLVWAAMYLATYDTFELMDMYPFVGLFVISFLLFRMETRVVAAILFGIMVFAFYIMSAKELGERDAERLQVSTCNPIECFMEAQTVI